MDLDERDLIKMFTGLPDVYEERVTKSLFQSDALLTRGHSLKEWKYDHSLSSESL